MGVDDPSTMSGVQDFRGLHLHRADLANSYKSGVCQRIWLSLCMLKLRQVFPSILRLTTAASERSPCTMANMFALSGVGRMVSTNTSISATGFRVSHAFRVAAMPPVSRARAALQGPRSSSRFNTMVQAATNGRNMSAHAAAVRFSRHLRGMVVMADDGRLSETYYLGFLARSVPPAMSLMAGGSVSGLTPWQKCRRPMQALRF